MTWDRMAWWSATLMAYFFAALGGASVVSAAITQGNDWFTDLLVGFGCVAFAALCWWARKFYAED